MRRTAIAPPKRLPVLRLMFALRAHCGRDARGPSEELERLNVGGADVRITFFALRAHCGRDARAPSEELDWMGVQS